MVMAPSAVNAYPEYAPLSAESGYDLKPTTSYESSSESAGNDGGKKTKKIIGAALQKHIQGINPHDCEAGEEDAFFVADMGDVYRQHQRWKKNLQRITPHYLSLIHI